MDVPRNPADIMHDRAQDEAVNKAYVEVWRGSLVESRHRVSLAVVDASGRLRASAGDPKLLTFARSAVKPVQALPIVEDGALDRFGLSEAELALCCASHSGEGRHVDGVRSILEKIGMDEDALACGPHPPMHEASARALERMGERPDRIHNNCSGKHAGMLALIRLHGWPLADYGDADHPVQHRMLREIARWTETEESAIPVATDGCGVCTFGLSLDVFAGAFARLAAEARRSPRSGPARIVQSMLRHPEYVAGTGRLCTDLMREAGGRIFVKVGADGVYAAGVPGAELGVALKVEDGGRRAVGPALVAVLRALGLLSEEEMAALESHVEPHISNTRGERVGRIHAVVELETGRG